MTTIQFPEALEAAARADKAEAALRKFRHGIPRIDHTPTRLFPSGPDAVQKHDAWWQDYFNRANEIVKEEACAALPESALPKKEVG